MRTEPPPASLMNDKLLREPIRPVLPGKNQVRSANLNKFPELVRNMGENPIAMLDRYDIDYCMTVERNSLLGCQEVVNVLEYAATLVKQPLFGIYLAEHQDADVMGYLTAMCRAASTLGEAVSCLIEYIPVLHSPESVLTLVVGRKVTEFRASVRSDFGINEQANLHGMYVILKILRMIGGTDFRASYLGFPLDKYRKAASGLEKAVRCQIRFTEKHASIAFPTDALTLPIYSGDQFLFGLLSGHLKHLQQKQETVDLEEKVESYIRANLGKGPVSINACAKSLGLAPRTLQAQLKVHGTTFFDLLEQQRIGCAKELLNNQGFPIGEISDRLGYTERTSFTRAFKRWTGLSPHSYRSSLLDK